MVDSDIVQMTISLQKIVLEQYQSRNVEICS